MPSASGRGAESGGMTWTQAPTPATSVTVAFVATRTTPGMDNPCTRHGGPSVSRRGSFVSPLGQGSVGLSDLAGIRACVMPPRTASLERSNECKVSPGTTSGQQSVAKGPSWKSLTTP